MEEDEEMEEMMLALAETSVTIKNIERELICPACKELFTHPLILPCQHSVCHKCVKELLFLNHEDSFTDVCSEASSPGSPRIRLLSPSVERIDRIDRLLRSSSERQSLRSGEYQSGSLFFKYRENY